MDAKKLREEKRKKLEQELQALEEEERQEELKKSQKKKPEKLLTKMEKDRAIREQQDREYHQSLDKDRQKVVFGSVIW